MFSGFSHELLLGVQARAAILISMTNMYTGAGSDDMPTAPYHVPGTGNGPDDRRSRRKWLAVLIATCVVAAGGAFAVVEATTGQTGPASLANDANQASASQAGASLATASSDEQAAVLRNVLTGRRLARLRLLGGMYGQYTFGTKQGPRTLAFERGAISSIAGNDVTIRASDGTTWVWVLTGTSVVREDGTRMPTSTLKQGQTVFAGGPVASGLRDARLIVIRQVAAKAPATKAPTTKA
jgi:hypothetical protein